MQDLNGITHTWEEFSRLDPQEICQRTGVVYDEILCLYTVESFGQEIFVSPKRQDVFSDSPEGRFLLDRNEYFFDLSVLWYMISSKDIPLTGELIKPTELSGGQIFVKGTHVLPLDEIAEKFNNNKELFLSLGRRFGGSEMDHGDAAVKLEPFPNIPVFIILWFGDEDFTPKGQLLLDSSCSKHLSTDVLWAITMVCCLLFLQKQ